MSLCARHASTSMTGCFSMRRKTMTDLLRARAKALQLHGLLQHWEDIGEAAWLPQLIEWEENERARRSLERRIRDAHLGDFKALCDFDWSWPTQCDQDLIEESMRLEFIAAKRNLVFIGPHGTGKTML